MTADAAFLENRQMLFVVNRTLLAAIGLPGTEQPRHLAAAVGPQHFVSLGMWVAGGPGCERSAPGGYTLSYIAMAAGRGTCTSAHKLRLRGGQSGEVSETDNQRLTRP